MSDLDLTDSDDEQYKTSKGNVLFNKAADHVQQIHQQIKQSDLLYLYAHYKQATVGPCNTDKPGLFQMQARAKWQAWHELGTMSCSEAEDKYVNKVKTLDSTWYDMQIKNSKNVGWVVHSTLQRTRSEEAVDESKKTLFDWLLEGNLSALEKGLAVGENKKIQLLQELDEHGMALIHWAADRNLVDLLEYLLKSGADVNLQDKDQQTALHYASSCGNVESIRLLLKYGANCKATDADGQNCIDVAENDKIRAMLQISQN